MHIFFTDLDGTLLNRESLISSETLEAIKAYMAAGNIFVIASGRPLSSITNVMKLSGLPSTNLKIISNNGSLIYDCDTQSPILDLRMPKEDAVHIIDVAEEMGIHAQTYNSNNVICRRHDAEIDFYTKYTRMTPAFNENLYELMPEDPYKALAISLDNRDELVALQNALKDWMEGRYTSFFSSQWLVEFVDIRSGKGNAVRFLCDKYGVSTEDAYAAGDAENDLSMLEAVGNSVAMLNATDEVISVSRFITEKDHDHNGLADLLLKLAKS